MKLRCTLKAGCAALVAALAAAGVNAKTLTIGTLPAADAIVLYAAQDSGAFKKHGLDVKVVPFKSAVETGAAMRAGRIDGHFGDLMNVIVQAESGIAQKIVVTTTHTNANQRAFGFVTSPKAAATLTDLTKLKNTPSAMSSATIIDYLLDRMSEEEKLPADALKKTEVKAIPIRLQMLLSGQIDTALLPEPLVSLAEAKGGKVLWDDTKLNEALAMVALKAQVADPATVKAFRASIADAAKAIEADPAHYRALMVNKGLLPPPLKERYKMIRFSLFGTKDGLPPAPTAEDLKRVGEWMVAKKMVAKVPAYNDIVAP